VSAGEPLTSELLDEIAHEADRAPRRTTAHPCRLLATNFVADEISFQV
jgi:hypothetical protein